MSRFDSTSTRYARYELVRAIAAGGMAQIYEARAIARDGAEDRVALKRILPEYAARRDIKRLFFDEARIAQRLDHPSIVRVLDFGSAEGAEFLVFELVEGLDAEEAFRLARFGRRRLPPGALLRILADTASALAHAHRAGVVHRDVSPSNILLSWDGAVKLADFGIALFAESERTRTATGLVRGKASFMSPEQARGERVGPAADVWALGATLAALDVGAVTFEPGALHPELAPWIARCTAPDPHARPDAATLAAEAEAEAAAYDHDALARALGPLRESSGASASAFDRALDLCLIAPELGGDAREFTVEHRKESTAAPRALPSSPPSVKPSADADDQHAHPSTTGSSEEPLHLPVRRQPALWALLALVALGVLVALAASGPAEVPSAPTDAATEPPPVVGSTGTTALRASSSPEPNGIVAAGSPAPSTATPPTMSPTPAERVPTAPSGDASGTRAAGASESPSRAQASTASEASAASRSGVSAPAPNERDTTPTDATPADSTPSDSTPSGRAPQDATPDTGWLRVAGAGLFGARVQIDGHPVGHAPILRELPVGTHRVEALDPSTGEPRLSTQVTLRPEHRRASPETLIR